MAGSPAAGEYGLRDAPECRDTRTRQLVEQHGAAALPIVHVPHAGSANTFALKREWLERIDGYDTRKM